MAWVIVDSDLPRARQGHCEVRPPQQPVRQGRHDRRALQAGQASRLKRSWLRTIKEYNEAVKLPASSATWSRPARTRSPIAVAKAPFYAVPFQGGMTATFGGPLINAKAEIQSLDGTQHPRPLRRGQLPRAASSSHNYAGGAQLGAATVFGRIAGNEIAARAKAQKN